MFTFYRSDSRKPLFILRQRHDWGDTFDGERYTISGDLEYQFRPYVNLSLGCQL